MDALGGVKHGDACFWLSTFLQVCIMNPLDLQYTRKAAKVRGVCMYFHTRGFFLGLFCIFKRKYLLFALAT